MASTPSSYSPSHAPLLSWPANLEETRIPRIVRPEFSEREQDDGAAHEGHGSPHYAPRPDGLLLAPGRGESVSMGVPGRTGMRPTPPRRYGPWRDSTILTPNTCEGQ